MTSQWRAVEDLFQEALEWPGGERKAFLDERCGSDDTLRQEVEDLLDADAAAGDFIEQAVAGGGQLLSHSGDPLAARQSEGESQGKTQLLGKYEVLERIGEGGFGAVYKGRDTVLQRFVAIKVCTSRSAALRRRFVREAEIAAGLQHPNVTILHDLGKEDGIPFLVQEFLDGEDLEQIIGRREDLPLDARLDVLAQVARGLEYAHRHEVLHRDVKPANVRLLPNGRAKIMDFGIARLLTDDTGLTQDGESLGTAGYLAPELLRSEELDPRADLFAFGVLAYELLTYEKPFPGGSFSQISYRVLYEEPEPLTKHWPECPPALNDLVLRCLEKDRAQRFSSASGVLHGLETLIAESSQASAGAVLPLQPSGLLQPIRWVLVGLAVAALAAFLVVQTRAPKPAENPTVTALPAAELNSPDREATPPASDQRPDTLPEEPSEKAPQKALSPPDDRAPTKTALPTPADSPPPETAPRAKDPPPEQGPALAAAAAISGTPPTAITVPSEAPASEEVLSEPAPSTTEPVQEILDEELAGPAPWPLLQNGPEVIAPEILRRPTPTYPEAARRRRREATVVIAVLVDGEGKVEHALVKQRDASGLGFNEAALAAARRALFRPARQLSDGRPGKMWTEISFDFQLE